MSDLPDFSEGVYIVGYTITSIPVDIIAQTLGTINIDITAQTIGDINVNITNATITVTGTVSISGTVTISGAVTVTGTVSISGTVTVTGTVAVSGTVTISGAVTVTGSVTITGTVNITGTMTVTIDGTVTVDGEVSISGTVTVSGAVTVSGTVSISGTVTVTGTVAVSGSVTITGSVSITGSVTITGAITVTSGNINIATAGGTNIIIDELVQGACTERRSTVSNHGTLDAYFNTTGNQRMGKFFPRGMRGFIDSISTYCKDDGVAGGTITIYWSPHPSLGAFGSAVITLGSGSSPAWKTKAVCEMWNYDSLFIWFESSTADMDVGQDNESDFDFYISSDSGVTWTTMEYRLHIRVEMTGQTLGNIPVSGIINNIEILSASIGTSTKWVEVQGVATTILTVSGAGKNLWIALDSDSVEVRWLIFIDGVQLWFWSDDTAALGTEMWEEKYAGVGVGLGVMVTKKDVGNSKYAMEITLPLEWEHSLVIKAYTGDASQQGAGASIIYRRAK